MLVTIFRSRLKPDIGEEYQRHVDLTSSLVESAPGFKGHKLFTADDGERLTIVEFEDEASQRAFSLSREHIEAAKAGRARFYSEYKIQICTVRRESHFVARDTPVTVPAK